jgi:tRNA(fMet)-specific endonuclease VapC
MTLLDTDVLSRLMAGNERLEQRAREAGDVAITIVTRIEVLQGRFASVVKAADGDKLLQAQDWLERNEAFIEDIEVVPFDETAAGEFDRLRQDKKLKKIGRADLLIACIALAQGATLVTRNLRHFRQVPGLKLENWAD